MVRRTIPVIIAILSSTVLLTTEARAQTSLNRAVLSAIRNQVQVLQQNQSARAARISDVVTPGQGVSTARASLAELRFNDGSLGRLGEQVVFWFTPGTRNFRISNGTALFLITPGQGRTRIQTPNATAGIQGSALFVRYIPETDTTIIGALTDSGIQVFNRDASQQQSLRGGQMAVAIGDRIEQIYDFDLNTFYETSTLVRGLAPTEERSQSETRDATISQVQEEMQTAIEQQQSLPPNEVIETPSFVRTPESSATEPSIAPPVFDNFPDSNQVTSPLETLTNENQPRNTPLDPNSQPAIPSFQNRSDQVITDPRVDDRRNPTDDRPGNGNGRPNVDDRPGNGNGNGRPDNPGNSDGNGQPDVGDRPGNGNGRPNVDDRPGNGNGNGNGNGRPDNPGNSDGNGQPDVGDRPGNGNGRPNVDDRPGNGNGNGRPDNPGNSDGNGQPDVGDRPGNGNGRPNVDDRPGNGNGNGRPDNPGNSDGNGQPDAGDRPGNGNGRPDVDDRPGNGNGNGRPDNPGNSDGNGQPDVGDRPGNGNGRPNVDDRPGNGNGNGNGDDRPSVDNRPGNGNGNDNERPNVDDRPGNGNGNNDRDDRPGNGNGNNDRDDRPGNGNGNGNGDGNGNGNNRPPNGNGNNRPDRDNERRN